MRIIEIQALDNGAHRNQEGDFMVVPNGYAVIPGDMETTNFPFGKVTAKEVDGVMTVTNWVPVEMPKYEEPEQPISDLERLRADIDFLALMTEVDL